MPYADPIRRVEYHRAYNRKRAAEYGVYNRARHKRLQGSSEYREKRRADGLRLKYNLTLEQFADMLTAQHGRCALCNTADPGKRGSRWGQWQVDHDYATKKIRGLLCGRCNRLLGWYEKTKAMEAKIALYLRGNQTTDS